MGGRVVGPRLAVKIVDTFPEYTVLRGRTSYPQNQTDRRGYRYHRRLSGNLKQGRFLRWLYISKKREDYISWDEYFMGVAMLSGMRSKDPNSQVGACIVKAMITRSFPWVIMDFQRAAQMMNFPWAREGDPLDTKYLYVTHSELNAILNYRGGSLEGAKLYVSLFPCNECAKAIIRAGIKTVVYDRDKYEHIIVRHCIQKDAGCSGGVRYYKYNRTGREIKLLCKMVKK